MGEHKLSFFFFKFFTYLPYVEHVDDDDIVIFFVNRRLKCYLLSDAFASTLWICSNWLTHMNSRDQEVTCSTPRPVHHPGNNSGQVADTHVPL